MSRGTSNGYLVVTDVGDVVINCGATYQGERYRERYEQALGRPLQVKKIVLTQDHFDHIGGWPAFYAPGCETIAHRDFPRLLAERTRLAGFFAPRGQSLFTPLMPRPEEIQRTLREPRALDITTLVEREYPFELGGRQFVAISAPAGETQDALWLWSPEDKTLFVGNWMGALYGALPHIYTLRGDRQRSVVQFLSELDSLMALQPELLITGHDEPIAGWTVIRRDMEKLQRAVRHLLDETLSGMASGKSLWQLMGDVALPEELRMAPGRGPERWYVRAIYEEHTGWFRHELTSELYATPPTAIWPELAGLCGGVAPLLDSARRHLESGNAEKALHFVEIALAREPANPRVRATEIAALEQLLDNTGGRHYDELAWLETRIAEATTFLQGD
jgi:glyoxylase-like metal-dependent hydrolase (beta-lactamase superfamily II)